MYLVVLKLSLVMYKIFSWCFPLKRYIPFPGVYPFSARQDLFISIPFNGVHVSEATGYSLSDIKYRAPRVSLGAKREGPGI